MPRFILRMGITGPLAASRAACAVTGKAQAAEADGFFSLSPQFGTRRATATIALPLSLQPPKMSTHRAAKLPLLQRFELLADVDVVEQHVYDYGRGTVSPLSRLLHCTVVALAMLAPPVINDLESQNRSVPFPLIWVKGFDPSAATDDKLATTKPP